MANERSNPSTSGYVKGVISNICEYFSGNQEEVDKNDYVDEVTKNLYEIVFRDDEYYSNFDELREFYRNHDQEIRRREEAEQWATKLKEIQQEEMKPEEAKMAEEERGGKKEAKMAEEERGGKKEGKDGKESKIGQKLKSKYSSFEKSVRSTFRAPKKDSKVGEQTGRTEQPQTANES